MTILFAILMIMPYSQKYCLVHFVDLVDKEYQFDMSDWPVHITIADVFAIDTNIEPRLSHLCSKSTPFTITATDDLLLGEMPVMLFDESPELLQLHMRLVSLLEANGVKFNHPEFTKAGFIAHSTIQRGRRLHSGDQINVDSLSLIDMFPDSDWQQRKVIASFKLKNQTAS
jgi:hypothetical protein